MGGTPTLVSVLAGLVTALGALLGWMMRQLVKGKWVPENTHVRELGREQAAAEGWKGAYFTLLDAHDRLTGQVGTLMAGTRASTRVMEALPMPQPPDPPEGTPDAQVVA
jgi:hypothetical protein